MALAGKAALVLGGASGIGFATSEELLRAGADVAICDVASVAGLEATKKLQRKFGTNRCFFVQADVRNDATFEAAVLSIKDHFTKLDILINSAGVLNDHDWNFCVDVNLKGIMRGTLLAWKHMGKEGGGNGGIVVNIASILGLTYIAGAPVYTATKHAVVGWGRSCGAPFNVERTGVQVMTVCPGVTETPLIVPTGKPQFITPEMSQESYSELSKLPIQKPEDVAGVILHMIQHGTSGSVWVIEGGESYEVEIPERNHMRIVQ